MNPRGARALVLLLALALLACGSSAGGDPSSGDGLTEGQPLRPLALSGFLATTHPGVVDAAARRRLTATDVVAANPRAELLLVHVAFGWCKYCWEETAEQIKMTTGYGGRFVSLQVLVEDRNGIPATDAFVDEWIRLNKSAMATTLEPEGSLFKRFGKSATYMLIDPRNMKVLVVGAGPPTFGVIRDKIRAQLGALPQ